VYDPEPRAKERVTCVNADKQKSYRVNGVRQKVWRMVWSILFVCGGAYVGLGLILLLFQSRYLYFPERRIAMTPDSMGLSYEPVEIETDDGVTIAGWFVPAEPSRGVVLFCHGNAGNMSHRLDSIRLFNRLELSTFIFDYRGYGQSGGKTTETGTYRDVEAAWRYLLDEREIEPTEIVVFGRSLGGAIASWLAQEHTPAALIVESTFTSVPDLAAKLYPIYPVRWIGRFNYNAAEYVAKKKCPVLVVHSRDDDIIPFSHGRQLFDAASEPKEFLEIRGSHNEGFVVSGKPYQDGLDAFISRYIGTSE